jgi:hypothetical protein
MAALQLPCTIGSIQAAVLLKQQGQVARIQHCVQWDLPFKSISLATLWAAVGKPASSHIHAHNCRLCTRCCARLCLSDDAVAQVPKHRRRPCQCVDWRVVWALHIWHIVCNMFADSAHGMATVCAWHNQGGRLLCIYSPWHNFRVACLMQQNGGQLVQTLVEKACHAFVWEDALC